MTLPFDRNASAAASRVLALCAQCGSKSGREWIEAMSAELREIDGGWRQLTWSMGALPVLWETRHTRNAASHEPRSVPMPKRPFAGARSTFDSALLNVIVLVAWILGATLVQMTVQNGLNRLNAGITLVILCALGAYAALFMRTRIAASLLAGFGAFQAVRIGIELCFGFGAVRGWAIPYCMLAMSLMGAVWIGFRSGRTVATAK